MKTINEGDTPTKGHLYTRQYYEYKGQGFQKPMTQHTGHIRLTHTL